MSYGIWRNRGNGWSSIEIDSPGIGARQAWMWYASIKGEKKAVAKKKSYIRQGLGCSEYLFSDGVYDDTNFLTWASNQVRKGWHIHELDTGTEHFIWLAVADNSKIPQALESLQKNLKTYQIA